MQRLLWVGTVLDLIFFLPALYAMGVTLGAAGFSGGSSRVLVMLAATALLPALCILAPGLAWRCYDKRQNGRAIGLLLLPFVYAGLMAIVCLL